MLLLSDVKPALPFIIEDIHPQYVCEELDKLFPDVDWEYVSFDDNDDDFMFAVSYKAGVHEAGSVCVEIRTGKPLVLRPLMQHEARNW